MFRIDINILKRNIQFIAEALAKYVYHPKVQNVTIFKGSLEINSQFIESWIKTFSSFSRSTPFIKKDDTIMLGLKNVKMKN